MCTLKENRIQWLFSLQTLCNCPCMSDCYSCTVLLCQMCLIQCLSHFSQRQVCVGVSMFTHARTTADSVLVSCHTVCWVGDKLNCALLLSVMMCAASVSLGDTSSYHGYTCVADEGQLLHSSSAEHVVLEVLLTTSVLVSAWHDIVWWKFEGYWLYCWQGQWWLDMVVGSLKWLV